MRRIHSLLLMLIALWLPLQAAAAWTMPLCAHAAHEQAAQGNGESMPCHMDMAADDVAVPANDLGCDNCGICHLASSGYLLAVTEPIMTPPMTAVLVPAIPLPSASHLAEPLSQPPRRI